MLRWNSPLHSCPRPDPCPWFLCIPLPFVLPSKMVQLPRNIKPVLRMVCLAMLRVAPRGLAPQFCQTRACISSDISSHSTRRGQLWTNQDWPFPAPCLGGEVRRDIFKTDTHEHLYLKLLKLVFGWGLNAKGWATAEAGNLGAEIKGTWAEVRGSEPLPPVDSQTGWQLQTAWNGLKKNALKTCS